MFRSWHDLRWGWVVGLEERVLWCATINFIMRVNAHPHNWLVIATADHGRLDNLWMKRGRLAWRRTYAIRMWMLSRLDSTDGRRSFEVLQHPAAKDLLSWLSLLIQLFLISFKLANRVLDLIHQVKWKFLNVADQELLEASEQVWLLRLTNRIYQFKLKRLFRNLMELGQYRLYGKLEDWELVVLSDLSHSVHFLEYSGILV